MGNVRLEKEVEAAWDTYASTVHTGGTDEQRRWAYEKASKAEDKLMRVEQGEKAREKKQADGAT